MTKREPRANIQDNGEEALKAFQRSLRQPLSSQAQRLRKKNGFLYQVHGPAACLGRLLPAFQSLWFQPWLKGVQVQLRPRLCKVQAIILGSFPMVLGLQMLIMQV